LVLGGNGLQEILGRITYRVQRRVAGFAAGLKMGGL
jgi:hypothetical protein